jgi:hypothetical protein
MNVVTVIVQRSASYAPSVDVFKKVNEANEFAAEAWGQLEGKHADAIEAGTMTFTRTPGGHIVYKNEAGCIISMVCISKERVQ